VTAVEPVQDSRLRRAQAIAGLTQTGLTLAHELISAKLRGQVGVARSRLDAPDVTDAVEGLAEQAFDASKVELVRRVEAEGASLHWKAWTGIALTFARKDRARVPAHWLTFGSRRSRIHPSGPRYASDPLAQLLEPPFTLYAWATVARQGLEAAGRAYWLVDPNLALEERIHRSLSEQLKSVTEQADLHQLDPMQSPDWNPAEVESGLREEARRLAIREPAFIDQ
jgi:hypothetical protein